MKRALFRNFSAIVLGLTVLVSLTGCDESWLTEKYAGTYTGENDSGSCSVTIQRSSSLPGLINIAFKQKVSENRWITDEINFSSGYIKKQRYRVVRGSERRPETVRILNIEVDFDHIETLKTDRNNQPVEAVQIKNIRFTDENRISCNNLVKQTDVDTSFLSVDDIQSSDLLPQGMDQDNKIFTELIDGSDSESDG